MTTFQITGEYNYSRNKLNSVRFDVNATVLVESIDSLWAERLQAYLGQTVLIHQHCLTQIVDKDSKGLDYPDDMFGYLQAGKSHTHKVCADSVLEYHDVLYGYLQSGRSYTFEVNAGVLLDNGNGTSSFNCSRAQVLNTLLSENEIHPTEIVRVSGDIYKR